MRRAGWMLILLLAVQTGGARMVARVVDGDTLEMDNGDIIRLLGVDTPETKHTQKGVEYFGPEASALVRKLALSNTVTLKYDKNDQKGKYGRLLAYVYLPDGRMLNALLIAGGYGFATPEYSFSQKEAFVELEAEARAQGLGLWSDQGRKEYLWLTQKKQPHLEVIPMAGNHWGVLCEGYARLQLSHEELLRTLKQVRVWTVRLSGEELAGRLIQAGWVKVEKSKVESQK